MHEPLTGDGGSPALRRAEHMLLILGCALLATSALFLAHAALSQRAARESFQAAHIEVPSGAPQNPVRRQVDGAEPRVRRGLPLAALSIPRVHLSAIVLQGSDRATLLRGPGHLEHTAFPGEIGNAVIAGHRDSFFAPLRDIRIGDDITLATQGARFHYRVAWVRVVHPNDVSVLEATEQPALTLITCYPFWVLGRAPDRFIVRAVRVDALDTGNTLDAQESSTSHVTTAPPWAGGFVDGKPAPAVDDDTLIRQTVERLRVAYNGRLARHNEGTPMGPQVCEVTVDYYVATATCIDASETVDSETRVRTFTLDRADAGWAIRSIVVGPTSHHPNEPASSETELAEPD